MIKYISSDKNKPQKSYKLKPKMFNFLKTKQLYLELDEEYIFTRELRIIGYISNTKN